MNRLTYEPGLLAPGVSFTQASEAALLDGAVCAECGSSPMAHPVVQQIRGSDPEIIRCRLVCHECRGAHARLARRNPEAPDSEEVNDDTSDMILCLLIAMLLGILVGANCSGCIPRLTDPIQWEPIVHYETVELHELIATEPAPCVTGESVPFDGWLLTEADWQRVKDEIRRLEDALEGAYGQIEDDRWYCSATDAAQDEALKTARESQWRAFAAGAGLGAGACGVVGWGLGRALP